MKLYDMVEAVVQNKVVEELDLINTIKYLVNCLDKGGSITKVKKYVDNAYDYEKEG